MPKIFTLKIVKNIAEYSDAMGLTMSLGMFDGVHKGHQEIIKKLKSIVKPTSWRVPLLTFWPHPRKVLQPEVEIKLLNTLKEKLQLLERFGIQTFLQEFDDDFRNLSGEDFVKHILLDKLI
jgi:riboflavin kinase/FMN adenylyltransferase